MSAITRQEKKKKVSLASIRKFGVIHLLSYPTTKTQLFQSSFTLLMGLINIIKHLCVSNDDDQ